MGIISLCQNELGLPSDLLLFYSIYSHLQKFNAIPSILQPFIHLNHKIDYFPSFHY